MNHRMGKGNRKTFSNFTFSVSEQSFLLGLIKSLLSLLVAIIFSPSYEIFLKQALLPSRGELRAAYSSGVTGWVIVI